MEGGETMGDTLHKMQVKIEGDASSLKKELESTSQATKRSTEIIQKEIEKIKQSMSGKLSKIPKNISDTIKQSFQNIKSGAPFSAMIQNTRQYVKEAQLAAGIKVHTKEYEQNEKDIERVIQALERLEQKKRDLTNSRSGNEAERAKRSEAIANVKGQIKATEKQLESYQAYRQSMQFRNTDTERPYTGKLSDGNSFETAGAVMRQTAERIREVKEAATEAIKQVPVLGKVLSNVAYVGSKGWGGLKKLISGVANGIKTLASGAIQKSSGAFGALIQKFATGIPILKRTRSSFNGLGTSGKGLVGILKTVGMTAKFMFASFVIRGAINGAKEGFQNLAQYSSSTNASLSMLMSSLTQLKNSLATAFAPILDVVAPILNQFLQMIIQAVNAVGQLMGALTGKSTIVRAKKVNQDYAASLNGTSNGLKKNASNANKAQKEAEKYKRTLLGFDQINKMDDNSSSDTGSSGGADTGALGGVDNMFETTAVNSKFKDLAKLIKDSWKNADFTEVGAIVGRKLNAALQSIPWDDIKNTTNRIAKSIATFLNGFIETTDWGLVGSTLSQGLNTAIGFANTFAQNFHWNSLGKAISDGINGAVKMFDAATAGQTISNVVKGILDSFITAVENTDWQQLGKKVQEFLVNIDWKGIVEKLSEAIGAAFGGFAAFLWGLIRDAWKKVVQWWKDTAYKDGQFTISGLFNGIVDALKNVASWIKDHIFKPFINGFKKAFGIHSPSTVMSEQGGFIMSGLFKGLKDNLPNILTWVGKLPKKVKDKLGNAKDWLKDKGSQAIEGFAAGLKSIHIPLPHISVSWNSHNVGPVSFSTPSFGLNWYAKGGFPETGEMFVARENGPEMVGRMGRKNAVANNNQIIAGIRAGVYEAMVNALESSSGGDGQKTEVKVYLEGDSKKLFRVIRIEGQDYQKSTGKPVFD